MGTFGTIVVPPNTPITPTQLRAAFPALSDTTVFPDDTINFWAAVALKMLNACRWGSDLPLGMLLFVAHNIVLEAFNQASANAGGIPGISRGVVGSEAASKLSVGYDTVIASNAGAGHWNLTTYGTRMWALIRMAGMAPLYVGAGIPTAGNNPFFFPYDENVIGPGWRET